MAQKQGGSKKPRKRPGAPAARRLAEERKKARVREQQARASHNKNNKPTPWQIAKAERAKRRENVPMQSRTGLGNIVKKLPDGTTRIYPGSDKETKEALEYRARVREQELKEAARKKAEDQKRKTNAEKANRPAKKKAS